MLTATRPGLAVPDASLVVLAGLPGAGKTTLLRRIAASAPPGVLALDAEDVAARVPVGPAGYPLVRPFVHTIHLARVVAALAGPARCVLTTDPMTGPVHRLLLGTAARLTGRRLHLVCIDATVDEALSGQSRRGRALGRRRMAGHARRWPRLRERGSVLATSWTLLGRTEARTIGDLEITQSHDRVTDRPVRHVRIGQVTI